MLCQLFLIYQLLHKANPSEDSSFAATLEQTLPELKKVVSALCYGCTIDNLSSLLSEDWVLPVQLEKQMELIGLRRPNDQDVADYTKEIIETPESVIQEKQNLVNASLSDKAMEKRNEDFFKEVESSPLDVSLRTLLCSLRGMEAKAHVDPVYAQKLKEVSCKNSILA